MADEAKPSADSCVNALTAFIENGKALLELAEKESSEGSLREFIRKNIRIERKQSLLGLIERAAELYTSLHVKRIKDAEELWRRNNESANLANQEHLLADSDSNFFFDPSSCAALQDAIQQFVRLEVQWDAFLQELDDKLQLRANVLDCHPSKCISPETSLISAKTGETVTFEKYLLKGKNVLLVLIRQFSCLLCRLHIKDLEKNQTSLEEHSVEVLVISFGCQEGASHWLQETGCQYHMLLDPDRKVYAAFGLGASLKKVLNFRNMLLYAEYVMDNMEFPRGLPSIQDDMFQLGGDFLLDERGRVLFSHCCQSPIDRPSVGDILSALSTAAD